MEERECRTMPNITIYSWITSILKLSGLELLIFSYFFSRTFDAIHVCHTSHITMAEWFNTTRQTVARAITKLIDFNLVIKKESNNIMNPMLKHNIYCVNMNNVLDRISESNFSYAHNFFISYGELLKESYPDKLDRIDKYLEDIEFGNSDISILDIAVILRDDSNTEEDIVKIPSTHIVSISEFMNRLDRNCGISANKIENNVKHKNVSVDNTQSANTQNVKIVETKKPEKKRETEKKSRELFKETKPKSKRALHNEWGVEKAAMNTNFVFMFANNDTTLHQYLNDFIETDGGKSYTPKQWQEQLDNLYRYGRTVERMTDGVRFSYMNNYRTLYIRDKSEVEVPEKLQLIDEFVDTKCDSNEELRDLLIGYVTDVQKARSMTKRQFKLALDNLERICQTVEEKIESVKVSYTNSYASLAYPNNRLTTSSKNSQTKQVVEVDIDKKIEIIDKFIVDGYYQLVDGLKESLYQYVRCTDSGKSMTSDKFSIVLGNLRLFCLNDADKVGKVNLAIQTDRDWFVTENFAETSTLDKESGRESKANQLDRVRVQKVSAYKISHPNDERVKDVVAVVPTFKNVR